MRLQHIKKIIDLIADLKSELSGCFSKTVQAMMLTRAELSAKRLYEAIDGLGTKESLIIDILCPATNGEMELIKKEYLNRK
ncbi:unnamed protein product [Protopolystoma xenopodis]|uniref:Annexin n=1 Tax=Protopolystoma xenopodis TaxID=117903 RepID=A0A3S5B5E5_9PLAT|nr:unnamed protein product [Protopolystoma xenopodis]